MPFDVADLLRARHGENFALHDEHLNPQLVRTLKTIGFDRFYVRGEGCYLYDAEGERYLDLLVRVRGLRPRPEPPCPEGGAPPSDRPRPSQHGPDGLRPAAGASGGAARPPVPGQHRPGLFLQLGRRDHRGGHKVLPPGHAPATDTLRRTRLPRPQHRRPGPQRRDRVPPGVRQALARVRRRPVRRHRGSAPRAEKAGRSRVHRRADPGQRRLHGVARVLERGSRALPGAPDAISHRRSTDGPRPDREVPLLRALGSRAGHHHRLQGLVRGVRPGWRRAYI